MLIYKIYFDNFTESKLVDKYWINIKTDKEDLNLDYQK